MTANKERVYLDYAASTPVDPRVMKAMTPYFTREFGNPGSLHSFGQAALAAVDKSREAISRFLEADFREVIFTGSATEANNLALRGTVKKAKESGILDPRIIISAVEHESVLETARDLAKEGVDIIEIPVGRTGTVRLDALEKALSPDTILVSVMYANNETGAIQPIAEIAKIIRDFRAPYPHASYPIFHTDAAQALQFLDCRPKELSVDLMTLSGHKIYGPKGIGALYIGHGAWGMGYGGNKSRSLSPKPYPLNPILTGGGQEFGFRSGTENVPLAAGFGKAIEILAVEKAKHARHIREMKEYFLKGVKKHCPGAAVNGEGGIPSIANVYLPGKDTEKMLVALALQGLAVSSGSACRSRSFEQSYVLRAMGLSTPRCEQSLRVSFGRMTTRREIDALLREIGRSK